MVNFGFNSASVLGIFLAVSGAGLYFMRTLRPELSRDHDIFFAAVGLLSGFILIFQGWRLDPILQFSQLLLAGTAVFFAAETIRLRGFTTDQARRNSSIIDDERPTSRVYRAELAQIDGYEDEEDYENRRLQGTRDKNNPRRGVYEDEQPRPRRSRKTTGKYTDQPPTRSTRGQKPSAPQYDDWNDTTDHWEDQPPSPRRRSSESRESSRNETSVKSSRQTKKRRPKSAEDIVSSMGTEYVDYQPIDENDIETGKSSPKQDNSSEKPRGRNNAPNFDY